MLSIKNIPCLLNTADITTKDIKFEKKGKIVTLNMQMCSTSVHPVSVATSWSNTTFSADGNTTESGVIATPYTYIHR